MKMTIQMMKRLMISDEDDDDSIGKYNIQKRE
jgi:hypothetical protein